MVESIVSRRFEPFEKNTGFDKATCGEQNFEYIYSCGMWVKQIDKRLQIVGAQWKYENLPQTLSLRCAYLNGQLAAI